MLTRGEELLLTSSNANINLSPPFASFAFSPLQIVQTAACAAVQAQHKCTLQSTCHLSLRLANAALRASLILP